MDNAGFLLAVGYVFGLSGLKFDSMVYLHMLVGMLRQDEALEVMLVLNDFFAYFPPPRFLAELCSLLYIFSCIFCPS